MTFVSVQMENGEHREDFSVSTNLKYLFNSLEIVCAGIMNNFTLCWLVLLIFYCNPVAFLYKRTGLDGLIVSHVDLVYYKLSYVVLFHY